VFEIFGNEMNQNLGLIQHHVWYDSGARMLRWDKTGKLEPTDSVAITLTFLTNYTIAAGPFPAYVIDRVNSKCSVDGAD
jgi:hypothetical protein